MTMKGETETILTIGIISFIIAVILGVIQIFIIKKDIKKLEHNDQLLGGLMVELHPPE